MRLRDHYDWVILGDHPGALLSGCLTARLGLSVLFLPLGTSQKVVASHEGFWLDPETNFLSSYRNKDGNQGLLSECLDHLGISEGEAELFRQDSSATQILTPECRLQLPSGIQALESEMKREFGAKACQDLGLIEALRLTETSFIRFWAKLPERLTWSKDRRRAPEGAAFMNVRKLIRGLGNEISSASPDARRWVDLKAPLFELSTKEGLGWVENVLRGVWNASHAFPRPDLTRPDLLHALAATRTGASFKGGVAAYRAYLLRLARRLGADVPEKADCRRIFIQKGRLAGVMPMSSGTMVTATGGVLGCGLDQAREILTSSGSASFRRLKKAPLPSGWKFTVALSVHAESMPPGVSRRMIWQEPGAPTLEIEFGAPRDYGFKEHDEILVFLRSVLPFSEESLSRDYQKLLAARMLRKLFEVVPFLEYHLVRIYPDFRGESDFELREVYPFEKLTHIPENLKCFGSVGSGAESGIDGLFVASDESFPELGTLGPIVAAVEATAWIAHRSGLPGPFA